MESNPPARRPEVENVPAPGTVLCRLDEIRDPGGREFSFGTPPHVFEMFVMRKGDAAFSYVNDCPHTSSPLNWQPDVFLDYTRKHILCSTHGAQFRVEDGFCIWGPCKGDSLTPMPVRVENGVVIVA